MTRSTDDQRCAQSDIEQCVLIPQRVVTKTPAVITEQDDDRVVVQAQVTETFQHLADLRVRIANGRMVGVNEIQGLRLVERPFLRNSGVITQLRGVVDRVVWGTVGRRIVGRR